MAYSNSRDFDKARIRANEHLGLDANGNRFGEGTEELAAADAKKELASARLTAKRWAEQIDIDDLANADLADLDQNWMLLIGRPATEQDGSAAERIERMQSVSLFSLRNTPLVQQ